MDRASDRQDRAGPKEKRKREARQRERETTAENRRGNLDDAGKGADSRGRTQNGGRRLIRAPFTENLCTRSIKPAPRLSGRGSRGIQTTGESTIVRSFHPFNLSFSILPFPPPLPSPSLFFPVSFYSLFLSLSSSSAQAI